MQTIQRWALFAAFFSGGVVHGQDKISVTVTGGKEDAKNVVVSLPLSLSKDQAGAAGVTLKGNGQTVTAQLTAPSIPHESIPAQAGKVRRDINFILPALKAGETVRFDAVDDVIKTLDGFTWAMTKGPNQRLLLAQRPVLQYMADAYDDSTKESRDLTYKVFHHLYDPAGTRFVTNGGPAGLYPHHRGLMFGFNRVTYGDNKKADTWHCPNPVHVAHHKFLNEEAGPVLGRHRMLVNWHADKKTIFAQEERELTVYNVPGGTLVEFATRLKTTGGKVKLDGDPQHAGFQFRASREIDDKKQNKLTYYLRPDGKGKPGETRNWDAKNKTHQDLPWDAMSFVLGDKRYTVCYLNHPNNPKPSRFSERDYGRFGCYFEYEVTEDRPLVVNYRIWLQDGEMTGEQVQALSSNFTNPPTAK